MGGREGGWVGRVQLEKKKRRKEEKKERKKNRGGVHVSYILRS